MDDSDLNASAETGVKKTKKTAKRAPRATAVATADAVPKKTRTSKARGSKPGASSAESVEQTSLFEPSASAPAPAPAPVAAAPEPAPVPFSAPPERPVFTPSVDRSASYDAPAPAHEPSEQTDSGSREPVSYSASPDAPASSGEQGGAQPSGGGFQPAGGGGAEDDRGPWWKRKKDKKNKWKDKQGHGGGGRHGGAPHAQHPPQPPPPVLAPVHYGDLPDPARFADIEALDALAATLATGNGDAPVAVDQIFAYTVFELTAYARKLGLEFQGTLTRLQLLEAIFIYAAEKQIPVVDRGLVEITDKGYGFIVHEKNNYRLYPESTYLPETLIKRYSLRRGHHIEAIVQYPQSGDRCAAVAGIKTVMGKDPAEASKLTPFEELVPYYPLQRILLEAPEIHKDISMRAVDLLTPIGFGQRGLLVAPPRTGKTVLLQNIANSISHNFPEKKLILLLIDERPEEVTDFKRHTKGEVVSSTFDEAPESHVHAAEMVIEKSRRLVEQGEHVVILLDSITRLARAYNALAANSGKIMSGGVEATALQKPKRFFGSARNIEGGGSITIIGTALIDTGSRMDEVIFEEFKGTGNMELHLDRGLSDKRIFPAINIDRSGTRKEELIYHPEELLRVYGLRRAMQGIPPVEAMDMLIQRLKKTKTNAEFLLSLSR
jgi:transcription termination factor Rho